MIENPSSFFISEAVNEAAYKYDYSCVLFPFPDSLKYDFIKACEEFVDPRDLQGKGIEQSPHLTLRYGLTTSDPNEVQQVLKDFGALKFTTFFVSAFLNDGTDKDFDVLKLDVLDPLKRLNKANELLGELPNNTTYSTYSPHVTIAYVRKGQAYKYLGKPFSMSFIPVESSEMTFSDRNGEIHTIYLSD